MALEREKESSERLKEYTVLPIKYGYNNFPAPEDLAEKPYERILLPAIGKEAPVTTARGGSEAALNSGALMLIDPSRPNSLMVFGHSSSETAGPYRYLFTRLPKMGRGDQVVLEKGGEAYVYTVSDHRVMPPKDLPGLPDTPGKLYLVTCYPFLSTLSRYVVEAELSQIVPRMPR